MVDREQDSLKSDAKLLYVKGLYKNYTNNDVKIEVLKNLDFSLSKKETVAIVGASGIGKSTLLHIFGTLDRPDKGTLLFQGQDIFLFDNAQLAGFRNESIGFVFQFHHLLPEFTALENVMMPLLIRGVHRQKAKKDAEWMLFRVGLSERLAHRVVKLSGGEQQRVALARAIVGRPDLLLADEPTGNLDKKNSDQIHSLLLELNKELGMTLIVVTHNLKLAGLMSHRLTLTDGKLETMHARSNY